MDDKPLRNSFHYVEVDPRPERKTSKWHVVDHKSGVVVGLIRWNRYWKCYCFFTAASHIPYSRARLADIQRVMDQLNEQRRTKHETDQA